MEAAIVRPNSGSATDDVVVPSEFSNLLHCGVDVKGSRHGVPEMQLSRVKARPGVRVSRFDAISTAGDTGRSHVQVGPSEEEL
jgi:hypothetical protein